METRLKVGAIPWGSGMEEQSFGEYYMWSAIRLYLHFVISLALLSMTLGCGSQNPSQFQTLSTPSAQLLTDGHTIDSTPEMKSPLIPSQTANSLNPDSTVGSTLDLPENPLSEILPFADKVNAPEEKNINKEQLTRDSDGDSQSPSQPLEKTNEESATKKNEFEDLSQKLKAYSHPKNPVVRIPPRAVDRFIQTLSQSRERQFETIKNKTKYPVSIRNWNYAVIIDYTAPSTRRRFFLINLKTAEINAYYVAHGKGSVSSAKNMESWSRTRYFSNTEDSKASSLGYFITGNTYFGKHGNSLQLFGIQRSNSRAYDRAIVIHGAPYVGEDALAANSNLYLGMSWGCPALGTGAAEKIIPLIADGALVFSYHAEATPIAESKPYLLEPPRILAELLKSLPGEGSITTGKVESPTPEDDASQAPLPGEDEFLTNQPDKK